MSHHGSSQFPESNSDELKKIFESDEQPARLHDLLRQNKTSRLIATGNFPDGKLNETDEGEIMVAITTAEGRIIMNFANPVHWIGFTKEQAKQIAFSLQDKAGFSMYDWMRKWLYAWEKSNPNKGVSANSIINWIEDQPTTG